MYIALVFFIFCLSSLIPVEKAQKMLTYIVILLGLLNWVLNLSIIVENIPRFHSGGPLSDGQMINGYVLFGPRGYKDEFNRIVLIPVDLNFI